MVTRDDHALGRVMGEVARAHLPGERPPQIEASQLARLQSRRSGAHRENRVLWWLLPLPMAAGALLALLPWRAESPRITATVGDGTKALSDGTRVQRGAPGGKNVTSVVVREDGSGSIVVAGERFGDDAPAEAPPPAEAPRRARAPVPRPAVLGWSELVDRGQHERVLTAAEATGIDRVLAGVSAPDLAALADAARYARKWGLAERALVSAHRRFAGTREAATAAYLRARLLDDRARPLSAIVAAYDAYLREDAAGPFVEDARGRRMLVLARASDPRACEAARAYLAQHDRGPYAQAARGVCP